MKISQIEERFALIKKHLGDIDVEVRNAAGEFDDADEIDTRQIQGGGHIAFIDV